MGPVVYRLQLSKATKIHVVFHVSSLKKDVDNYNVQDELPPDLIGVDEISLEPESVRQLI